VNNVGYRQKENNAYGWSVTQNNVVVYVEYWWCPAVDSSKYPNGINWAYGTARPASGCLTLAVGLLTGPGSNYFNLGGFLESGSGQSPVDDGEDATTSNYYVCSNSYIWDYSNVANGSYAWKARMSSETLDYSHFAEAYAPNYQ
jgi:hypothetical protein